MKTIITLFSLFIMTTAGRAQDFNGWEFLYWKSGKDSVEKVLVENKSKLSEPNALDAQFKFQGMNTWLFYDAQNKLIKVLQRNTFSVNQPKEAEDFFVTFKALLIKKYGKPSHYKRDKKDRLVTMTWKLKFTAIALEYDYRYKVIDEFGAGSYWVTVEFEPAKED